MERENINNLSEEYYDHDDGINTCFLCEEPDYKRIYEITHYGFPFSFYRCQCGLIKQAPMPNDSFFEWFFNQDIFFSSKKEDEIYIWGYYDYFKDESDRMSTSKWRYKKLKKIIDFQKQQNIMKIGPATGTFLYVAQNAGHKVLGCDISKKFIAYAKENYQVKIDHGRFERQPYEDEQFDRIVSFNVIENVPNLDEFLTAISRTVRNGGYYIFNYVDMKNNLIEKLQKEKYFLYRPPVCYAFTRETITKLMEKYGFKITKEIKDIRVMTMEKILTLLGWIKILQIMRFLKLDKISLPIYAYPSKIVIAEKI